MAKHATKTRLLVAGVAAMAIAGGAYAFTAANTVPSSTVGAGSGVVSGYTVTALHYALNAASPANIGADPAAGRFSRHGDRPSAGAVPVLPGCRE